MTMVNFLLHRLLEFETQTYIQTTKTYIYIYKYIIKSFNIHILRRSEGVGIYEI